MISEAWLLNSKRSDFSMSNSSLPASILEKSKISLMMPNNEFAD